jgi:hypothetical protein
MLPAMAGTDKAMMESTSPQDAEDAAVPKFDVVAETAESVGEAVADAAPEPEDDQARQATRPPVVPAGAPGGDTPSRSDPPRRGPVTDPAESSSAGSPQDIAGDEPWGTGGDSPMGEGSDESAAPATDPAERRLSDR